MSDADDTNHTGPSAEGPPMHVVEVSVRSYELDGFGHLNHATFLNHFEYARFEALRAAGFPPEVLLASGVGIHVVRVEVDYLREARLDQKMRIETVPAEIRNTSMTLEQRAVDPDQPDAVFARARVVIVWINTSGRPTRIPEDVRAAMGWREGGAEAAR